MDLNDIKYTIGKPKRKINWAILLSLTSLSLSLFSFFFQNLRTTHLLKICMNNNIDENNLLTDTVETFGDVIQSFQAVVHNYGNRYEAILQTKINYSYDSIPGHGFFKELGEPFIIKPGEALLKEYRDTQTMKFLISELPHDKEPVYHVFFEFLLTGSKGEPYKKYMYVTDVHIDTINADLDYSRKYNDLKCEELTK